LRVREREAMRVARWNRGDDRAGVFERYDTDVK